MVFAFCGEIEAFSPDESVSGNSKPTLRQRIYSAPPGCVTASVAPGREGEDLVSGTSDLVMLFDP